MSKISDYIINASLADHYDFGNSIYALILSLSPRDTCDLMLSSINGHYEIRNWAVKKVSEELSVSYEDFHDKALKILLANLDDQSLRNSSAYVLDHLADNLPLDKSSQILDRFLKSKYVSLRRKAYRKLLSSCDQKYLSIILQNWEKYHDIEALDIVIWYSEIDYLLDNYKTFFSKLKPGSKLALYRRIIEKEPSSIQILKSSDEITYTYVLCKLGRMLDIEEAREILARNYQDDRIGLLLWCFGKMKLRTLILEYRESYK